jgi:EAL domain-containing protein (putative c-di-GMP-specific phosphodiesterase class I)
VTVPNPPPAESADLTLRGALEATLSPMMAARSRFTEYDLRRAIDRAQLRVHYQPKYRATQTGWALCGVEALLRWEHPDHGLVYPVEFIRMAERHGLIAGLTDFVLQTGLDEIAAWKRAGRRFELCVNMSSSLLTDADFPARLLQCLDARGVAPEQLTLEITEIGSRIDPADTLDILAKLRFEHVGVSLDDFGVGHSSLTQLSKLPFSEVKIDHSIGLTLPKTPDDRNMTRAIIDLGHHLGMKVCCEGVESAAALEFLHQAGCDFAQGYYLARPMTPEALAGWIGAQAP